MPDTREPAEYREITISDASDFGMLSGDLLNYTTNGIVGRVIKWLTGSAYTHSAMVYYDRALGEWWVAEVREWVGGRCVPLAQQLEGYSGKIDWYHADPFHNYDPARRRDAVEFMRRLAGRKYSYLGVLKAALARLPVLRLVLAHTTWGKRFYQFGIGAYLAQADADRSRESRTAAGPAFCSMAYDMAWWFGAGVDVVPGLQAQLTEPGHFPRSTFFCYGGTLVREEA